MALVYFSDSEIVSTSEPPVFKGLWIHYPDNPEFSSYNFLYGKNSRSYGIELEGTDLQFVGREYKVVEFGEHRNDEFTCEVLIPHGPDYYRERDVLRSFAISRIPVMVRDNRGHVVVGVIKGLEEGYEDEGSSFSFSVERTHQEITEII